MMTERIALDVSDGSAMSAYVARPDAGTDHPGILVFQEAFGVNDHIRDVTDRFARDGYTAIAPELFHRTAPGFEGSYTDFDAVRPHIAALKPESLEADIRASHEWLRKHAREDALVTIGFCMGGRVAFLANATVPLRAAASFYGGGITELLYRVPLLGAPMMMFWGGLDKRIPPGDARRIADALRSSGKEFASIEFSHAGHGFFCDARASYDPRAARQAWSLVSTFFTVNLHDQYKEG